MPNDSSVYSHTFSELVTTSWIREVPLHSPNTQRLPEFLISTRRALKFVCLGFLWFVFVCVGFGFFFLLLGKKNRFFGFGFKHEKFTWMSCILEANTWTANMFLQKVYCFKYERIQLSSLPPSFLFPLSSSYLYCRISSWTAKLSSYPNIQVSFSSELWKWTNDKLFLLQGLWKLIITLVTFVNYNNEQGKKTVRKSGFLSSE